MPERMSIFIVGDDVERDSILNKVNENPKTRFRMVSINDFLFSTASIFHTVITEGNLTIHLKPVCKQDRIESAHTYATPPGSLICIE